MLRTARRLPQDYFMILHCLMAPNSDLDGENNISNVALGSTDTPFVIVRAIYDRRNGKGYLN